MSRLRLIVSVVVVVAGLGAASTAQAAAWTALASGTTETINAIDYRGPGAYWYGTSTGKLFKNGAQAAGANGGGQPINDIAMSPDGSIGLAVANGGKILRSTDGGATWAAVASGSITSYPNTNCSGLNGGSTAITENLTAVSWGNATTAYITGPGSSGPSPILKSTNGGSNWTDTNRKATGMCITSSYTKLTDVVALQGSTTVWFVIQSFGGRYVSFDSADSVTYKNSTAVNHFSGQPRIAVSPEQPDWLYVVDREDDGGGLNFYGSTDSGDTFNALDHPNGNRNVPALYGIVSTGQTTLAAGSAGAIFLSVDAQNAYTVSDTGAFATTNWRTVSMASASSAAVAGQGGVIATSTDANTIPDLIAPSGAINDPGTVVAGAAKSFSATLTDNPGGSGIDPASITWIATASGASPVTGNGNPAALIFPIDGYWSITVNFKDLAGNAASATRSVTVGKAVVLKPTPTTKTTTAKVPGATVKFAVPKACVAPGKTFTVTLSWKKQKKKGNKFVKITRVDFYVGGKRVKIDKKSPFKQKLKVKASTKAGAKVKVKARAYIKVKKGKQPKKSLNSFVKTCG